MKKGDKTKEFIIQKSAELFNQKGYFGSSLSDIMEVTGLKKGGIYNHFENKDEIALAAFDYAVEVMNKKYTEAISNKQSAIEQLIAALSVYEKIIEDPPLIGGCPLLNTATESDDAHPALRERVRQAMDQWLRFIQYLIKKGIRQGEIKDEIDPREVAIHITSTFEGAVMLSKLYNDSFYVQQAIKFLSQYLRSLNP